MGPQQIPPEAPSPTRARLTKEPAPNLELGTSKENPPSTPRRARTSPRQLWPSLEHSVHKRLGRSGSLEAMGTIEHLPRQTNDSDSEHNPKGFCVNQITQFKIQPGTHGIREPLPRTRSDRDCGFIALEVRFPKGLQETLI